MGEVRDSHEEGGHRRAHPPSEPSPLATPDDTVTRSGPKQSATVRRIGVSAGAQIAGSLGSGVISVLVVRLLTRHLGVDIYGQYVVLIAFSTAANIIVDLGLNGIVFRDLARRPQDAGRLIGTNLGLRGALSVIAMVAMLSIVYLIYPTERAVLMTAAVLLAADIPLTVALNTAGSYYGSQVRSEYSAGFVFSGRVIFLAAIVGVSVGPGLTLTRVAGAYVFADALVAAAALMLVHRSAHIVLRFEPRQWTATLRRAAPLGVMQLMNAIYLYIDSILLSIMSTNREVALYGLSFNVIAVLATFSNMFASSLVPNLATMTAAHVVATAERAVYIVTCASVPLAVGGVVLARPIVEIFGGHAFDAATLPFQLLSVSLIFSFPATVLSYAAVAADRFRHFALATAVVLLSNVALNCILIPWKQATGAASALVASEALALVAVFLLFARQMPQRLQVSGLWRPLIAGVVMAVTGVALRKAGIGGDMPAAVGVGAIMVAAFGVALAVAGGIPAEARALIGLRTRPATRQTPKVGIEFKWPTDSSTER